MNKSQRKSLKLKPYIPLYIMMASCILYLVVFKYMPILGNVIAFKNYSIGKGILDSDWATPIYKHFYSFFNSAYFPQLMRNTMLISFTKLLCNTLGAVVMALMLNEVRVAWLKRTIQTTVYLPYFLSWVIIYGIVTALFSQTNGIVNQLLRRGFGTSIAVFSSNTSFFWMLILSSMWKNIGWGTIIYLAAIAGIDPTLYEAAKIDGANRIQCIYHVTLASIRSTIIIMLILNLGTIMDAGFDQIYVMYGIQVYEIADIIDTWVYRTGLTQMNYSLATAVSLFKTVISFSLIMLVNWFANRFEEGLW